MGAGIVQTHDYHFHNSFSQVFQTFEPSVQVLKDISYGKEDVPVSAANSVDNSLPEYIEYSKERLPQNGVNDPFISAYFDITPNDSGASHNRSWLPGRMRLRR